MSEQAQPSVQAAPTRPRITLGMVLIGLTLAGLFAGSLYLARHRLYQVDELENAYMARIEALGKQNQFLTSGALFLLPLLPLARAAVHSAAVMEQYRLIFLCVMWLNIFLIARATRVRLMSPTGACVLLAAATLGPLWDYGYEMRHDNLLLTGTLLLWTIGKPSDAALRYGYVALGALAALMQFTAFKAFMYWMPLSAACLLLPHPLHLTKHSRLALIAQWIVGAAVTVAAVFTLYQSLQLWDTYAGVFRGGAKVAAAVKRASHLDASSHFLREAPLLIAAPLALFGLVVQGLRSHGLRYFSWSSALPEALLAFGALGLFFINPTPFRYNLVPLSALLLVAGARVLPELRELFAVPALRATLVAILLTCHVAPFAQSSYRLFALSNERQITLMALAERMTDPKRDRVYAASGLVLTRDSIGYQWFLHTLNIERFYDGTFPTVRSMLLDRPAAVLIASYRTDWLRVADRMFIFEHYLPLADDFWVLGQVLPVGTGTFTCLHEGRYIVTHGRDEHVVVDGVKLPDDNVVTFTKGKHTVEGGAKLPTFIRWLGPRLRRLPPLAQSSHTLVFDGNF